QRMQGGPPGRAGARLNSTNFPLINGRALLERTASGATAVTVQLYGLEPGSTHVAHIHGGACSGPILVYLQDLVADHRGVATSFTAIAAPIDTENWWVNAHGWQFLPSPSIACGKVNGPPQRPARDPGSDGPQGPQGPAPR